MLCMVEVRIETPQGIINVCIDPVNVMVAQICLPRLKSQSLADVEMIACREKDGYREDVVVCLKSNAWRCVA